MGDESKIYIIQKSESQKDENNRRYAEVIATFNLCKMYYNGTFHKLIDSSDYTESYIYADDGNTKITEDAYGEGLKECSVDDMVLALEDENKDYRRINPALNFLKTIVKNKKQWGDVVVLHAGY